MSNNQFVMHVSARWLNLLVFGLLLMLLTLPGQSFAQQSAMLPSENPAYDLIERLQRRGHLQTLNPSLRPYTYMAIREALDQTDPVSLSNVEMEWHAQLTALLGQNDASSELIARFGVSASLMQSSSKRYDPLRPLGSNPFVDPRAEFAAVLGWQNVVAASGVTHDMFYDRDPDGLDVVNRFFMRSENTYLGFASRFFDIHIGRFGTHWNRVGIEAPLIGDDVRQYDKIAIRVGNERLSLHSVYGELDNLDSVGVFSGRGFKDGNVRRFVFAHRIDWRPKPSLTLTVFEGDLVSGSNAGLSLKYLQPFHAVFFEQDNTPKNFENNLMVGAGFHYHKGKISATGQFILDDVVIFDRSTVREEGRLEPMTAQSTLHVTVGGVKPSLDVGFSASLVSSMSYRTDQKEGQWSYVQRSLATSFADYVHFRLFADWYADDLATGLTLKPSLHFLAQGTGDFRSDFVKSYDGGRLLPAFLSGTESITIRPALGVDYRLFNLWTGPDGGSMGWEFHLTADVGVNIVQNRDHVAGSDAILFQNVAKVRVSRGF
jgi:hypothetical protein